MREQGHLSNPEAQRRLKNLEKHRRRVYDSDLRSVMQTKEGRRFLWRLLEDTTGLLTGSGSNVALELARHDGMRMVGIHLTNEIRRACPDLFVAMYQEQLAAQREEQSHKENAEALPESEA